VDELRGAELEMAVAEREAWARLRVAVAWHRAADAELAALDRPTWGGVVDRHHRATRAVVDSVDAVEAYLTFPPLD
jgi:hypothetical protein